MEISNFYYNYPLSVPCPPPPPRFCTESGGFQAKWGVALSCDPSLCTLKGQRVGRPAFRTLIPQDRVLHELEISHIFWSLFRR